jgi:hypothetical protein
MAVLAAIIAGGYTSTYNAVAMGQQEDGFRIRQSFAKEEVRSNTYGESVIEGVYRGGNCYLQGVFIERASVLKVAAASPGNPYSSAIGAMGLVGRLDFGLAQAVVLTAIASLSTASINGIASLTASCAIIDQNLSTEIVMANRASYLNLTFRLYPTGTNGSSDGVWFTVT